MKYGREDIRISKEIRKVLVREKKIFIIIMKEYLKKNIYILMKLVNSDR